MVLRQGDHTVQTFPAQRADESLAQRARLRCLWWRVQDPQSQVPDALIKLQGEDAIPVMQEKAIGVVSRDRLAQLLHGPLRGGVCGDVAVQEAPCRVFHDHKNVQQVKGRRDDHTKVAGDNGLGMVPDKGGPALGCHAAA